MLAFFKTLDETLGSGIGWSLSPTSVSRALGRLRNKIKGKESPSSMFLINTERSATSFSTTNCSLSEVTRRTIVYVDGGSEEETEMLPL